MTYHDVSDEAQERAHTYMYVVWSSGGATYIYDVLRNYGDRIYMHTDIHTYTYLLYTIPTMSFVIT